MPRSEALPPLLVLSSAALCAVAGCGGDDDGLDRRAAAGTVTVDGAPLAAGTVVFVPEAGTPGPRTSAAVTGGAFALPASAGPAVGRHRVEIAAADPTAPAADDESAAARLAAAPPRRPPPPPDDAGLTAEVAADGPNEFRFELRSRRGPPRRR